MTTTTTGLTWSRERGSLLVCRDRGGREVGAVVPADAVWLAYSGTNRWAAPDEAAAKAAVERSLR